MANRYLAVLAQFGVIDAATVQSMQQALALTGSADAARQYAEARLQEAYTQGLLAQSERLFKFLAQNDSPSAAQWDAFWAQENTALWASVKPAVTETAQQSAIMASIGLGESWRTVNQRVIEWTDTYYNSDTEFGSIPNLNLTARQEVGAAYNAWQRGELAHNLGLPSLVLELQPTFGEKRAQAIAITETTRIYSEATRQTGLANEFVDYFRFLSASDEKVCGYCGPLHGQIIEKTENGGFLHPTLGRIGIPPIHVRCRCRLVEETRLTAKVPLRDEFKFEGKLPTERKGLSYSKPKAKKTEQSENDTVQP